MYQVVAPLTEQEWEQYYDVRWQVLRAPLQQPRGSEKDEYEQHAWHRMIKDDYDNVVGVARLHLVSSDEAQIRYMAVSKDYQGLGLGRIVIEALEQAAVYHGVNFIELNARANAQCFYEKLNYRLIKPAHLLYDEIQHFLMEKQLSLPKDHESLYVEQLNNIWHETIPLSKAMNMQVCYFDKRQLFTSADLNFNKNLHNTMFAGSIYTQATLTGWAWVYFLLLQHQLAGDIVLADAKIKYLAPIDGAGVGHTSLSMTQGDIETLNESGKARIKVQVNMLNGDKIAAKFEGKYVVITKGAV